MMRTRFIAVIAAVVAIPAAAALASEGNTAMPAAKLGTAVTPEAGALVAPVISAPPVIRDGVNIAQNTVGQSSQPTHEGGGSGGSGSGGNGGGSGGSGGNSGGR